MRSRIACPLLFFLLSLFLLPLPGPGTARALSPGSPGSADPPPDAAALKAAARSRGLAGDRYWNILLHYERGLAGTESLVDDPKFFLSPRGKTDPQAELDATIDGLVSAGTDEESSPRCRFPARMEWLAERLAVDGRRLPPATCGYLDNILRRIAPRAAVLVFASGHMNSPASMFGHTFLRFDSDYESPLLSHAVNYAAEVDRRDNGLLYAVKGIFGYYPGYFSILNYFEKVKEYRDMDQRDLWEYPLRIPRDDVRRMVLHTLELQGIRSDYYFFKENCSYSLLYLIEAGAPSVDLTSRFSGWTIPADTLKAALAEGLAGPPVFRPSQARKIRHAARALDPAATDLAAGVAEGRVAGTDVLGAGMPEKEKARVLDIAAETLQLRYAKRAIAKDAFQGRFLGILAARSRIADNAAADPDPVPVPERPEQGHDSSRASLSLGVRGDDAFVEAGWRPAYHDLLDPDPGYTPGSQIAFSDLAIRYYPGSGTVRLQRWDLVDIVSLSPRDVFFRPVSWKFLAGMESRPFPSRDDRLAVFLNPGGGFTWNSRVAGLATLFAETEAAASSGYGKGYAAAAGVSAGLLRPVGEAVKVRILARRLLGVLGDRDGGTRTSLSLGASLALRRNDALSLEAGRTVRPGLGTNEALVSWKRYF